MPDSARPEDRRIITNREIYDRLGDVLHEHTLIKERLGDTAPDGKSGTGLVGDVLWLKSEMRGLLGLKNRGVGLLAGVVLALAVLTLGLKGAIAAVLGHGPTLGG